jgi:hypothetical protein
MGSLPLNPYPLEAEATEFGSAPLDRPVHLMRTGRGSGGKLAFLGEAPATEHRTARICRWMDRTGTERCTSWWEVRVTVPAGSRDVLAGHSLVLVEWPWSRAQVDEAVFKRPSKKGKGHRAEPPVRELEDESALLAWIAAQPQDYWEKGSRLTASVARPRPLQDGSAALRAAPGARLVFGACVGSPDDCADELYRSPEAVELMRRLENDRLAFWPREAARLMESVPKCAYPEVKEQAPALMHLAAKMALAGPVEDSGRWTGRPVMMLADAIFRNLVNLHNRRVGSRLSKEDTGMREDAADSAAQDTSGDWTEDWSQD